MDMVDLGDGISAISDRAQLPGVGHLTINAFVIEGAEPLLIDTQVASGRVDFLRALSETIDPAELRWIAITHTDADHIGNLAAVLEIAPDATLITNYTGFIKLSTHTPVHPRRVRLMQPGDTITVGDRQVTAFRPPLYDAPETLAYFEHESRVLFAADCFGGIEPLEHTERRDLDQDEWLAAMELWIAIDTPWAHDTDRDRFRQALDRIEKLVPESIRAGHLPLNVHDVPVLLEGAMAGLDGPEFNGLSHKEFLLG